MDRGEHRRTNYRHYPEHEREPNIAFRVGCRGTIVMAITPKGEESRITRKEVLLPLDSVAAAGIASLRRGPVDSPH